MDAMASPPSGTNSGMFAARSVPVKRSSTTGGVEFPSSSMWVRNNWVYGVFALDEKTSQRPVELKLCHEFISRVFARSRRASPPPAGMMNSSLSGISSM